MEEKSEKRAKFLKLIPTNFTHQTREFFGNSTLHGVRYIAEKGLSFGEKFMWFSCVAVGAVAAFVIIDSLWEKFQTNPTITGLDTDFHNQQMEFPTVAVCPVDPFDEDKVNETAYRTMAGYEDNFYEFIPLLEMLPKLSYDNMEMAYQEVSDSNAKLDNEKKTTLRQLVFRVAMSCESLFYDCKFRGESIPCCDYFKPLYSERGFCYGFNSRYIGVPDGETRNDEMNNLFETDKAWAVTFVLNHPSKVYLHSTEEITGNDMLSLFTWEDNFAIDLSITMKQTYTTEDTKQLTVGQRKCIFEREVDLDYFKSDDYSLSGCLVQCRMQLANKLCKCIPPFYSPASGTYKECSWSDFKCLRDYITNITDIKGCPLCELSCLNTVYESEKYTKVSISSSNKQEDFRVKIEFLTWPIIRYKREVLFGWTDLLVSFGGIAGLFLGFSLLSGAEIVYYFTMRAGCMFAKNRQELYALQREKESRPQTRYDLSLAPKLKGSVDGEALGRRRFSTSKILLVKPVEHGSNVNNEISDYGLETSISDTSGIPRAEKEINRRFHDVRLADGKKFLPRRTNIFDSNHAAPYSRRIKPLDKNFRIRSQSEGPAADVIFYGYLP